jgi:CRISPR-associated protein Csm4
MTTWKISWKPLSSLSTPLQSDTIFGHLCWAVNYLWAEKDKNKLTDFLNALKKTPCLILSSAFPAGSLPKPVIPVKDELLDDLRNILKNELKEITDLEISQVLKDLKKDKWIKRQDLQEGNFVYNIKNDLKSYNLLKVKK